MDPTPHIDFTSAGTAFVGLMAFIVPLVIRTFMKDRELKKEKAQQVLLQACRQAFNSVQSKVKVQGKDAVGDKVEAGLIALDRFLTLRRGTPATYDEKEAARAIFEALHGEFCPGGTGAPPPADPV